MTSVAELPEEVREAMHAGRTAAVRERGRTVARIVPVRRPSAADLRRMGARLNALDRIGGTTLGRLEPGEIDALNDALRIWLDI